MIGLLVMLFSFISTSLLILVIFLLVISAYLVKQCQTSIWIEEKFYPVIPDVACRMYANRLCANHLYLDIVLSIAEKHQDD